MFVLLFKQFSRGKKKPQIVLQDGTGNCVDCLEIILTKPSILYIENLSILQKVKDVQFLFFFFLQVEREVTAFVDWREKCQKELFFVEFV